MATMLSALQGVRNMIRAIAADADAAAESARAATRDYDNLASAAREAERAADTTSRVTGGTNVTVKGLAAALRSTARRTT